MGGWVGSGIIDDERRDQIRPDDATGGSGPRGVGKRSGGGKSHRKVFPLPPIGVNMPPVRVWVFACECDHSLIVVLVVVPTATSAVVRWL